MNLITNVSNYFPLHITIMIKNPTNNFKTGNTIGYYLTLLLLFHNILTVYDNNIWVNVYFCAFPRNNKNSEKIILTWKNKNIILILGKYFRMMFLFYNDLKDVFFIFDCFIVMLFILLLIRIMDNKSDDKCKNNDAEESHMAKFKSKNTCHHFSRNDPD